jgi:hypothetical protein
MGEDIYTLDEEICRLYKSTEITESKPSDIFQFDAKTGILKVPNSYRHIYDVLQYALSRNKRGGTVVIPSNGIYFKGVKYIEYYSAKDVPLV